MALVERTKRAVRFTPLGNAVVAKAHRILREAEELSDLVQSSGQPLSGEVRMSVIPTIAPFLLPRMLPRLRRERPGLKLFLREEPSAAAMESLHHGRADCVLLALPYPTGEVEKETIELDAFFVAFPKDDPRDPPDEILPSLIDENRLLLLEDGHCLKDQALAACNRPELRAGATMIGTSLHTLVQMVDNGLGADDAARNGARRGHPQRHQRRREAVEGAERQSRDHADLAQEQPPRRGIPPARRGAAGGLSGGGYGARGCGSRPNRARLPQRLSSSAATNTSPTASPIHTPRPPNGVARPSPAAVAKPPSQ